MMTIASPMERRKSQPRMSSGVFSIRSGVARTISAIQTPKEDVVFRRTGLSVGLVAGTDKDEPFGFDFYRSPKVDVKYKISTGNADGKDKLRNFADIEAKRLSFIPGPKYISQADWRENIKGRSGKFL